MANSYILYYLLITTHIESAAGKQMWFLALTTKVSNVIKNCSAADLVLGEFYFRINKMKKNVWELVRLFSYQWRYQFCSLVWSFFAVLPVWCSSSLCVVILVFLELNSMLALIKGTDKIGSVPFQQIPEDFEVVLNGSVSPFKSLIRSYVYPGTNRITSAWTILWPGLSVM